MNHRFVVATKVFTRGDTAKWPEHLTISYINHSASACHGCSASGFNCSEGWHLETSGAWWGSLS